jgi:hypothetical protein
MVSCRRSLIGILTFSLLLTACRTFASPSPTPDSASEPTSLPATATPAPDYVNRLRNAEYQLGLTATPQLVQLTDGSFSRGEPGSIDFTSVTMTDFIARGDLNGDGVDEYAAIVAENYGGTGTFVFLALFVEAGGSLKFQTSTLVDDRPLLNELSIASGEIFLDATIHGANDPMCCPTLRTERHYRLSHNHLRLADYVTFTPDGRPRTITIDFPANGMEVFRSVPIKGSVAIAPFENNLVYRIYDLGGVELAVGSITVTAADLGAPGVFDQTILLGNILSGTVIRLEVQDVNAEDGSLFAMDSVELVVK